MNVKITTLLFILVYCFAPRAQQLNQEMIVDTTFISEWDADDQGKALGYLEMAERLLNPPGFMFAHELVKKSLTLDPTNKKAQFIDLYLQQLAPFKGSVTKLSEIKKKYSTDSQAMKNITFFASLGKPGDSLYEWFRDSDTVFKTDSDIQKDLIKARDAALKLRDFLKDNPDLNFKMTYYQDTTGEEHEFFGYGKTNLKNCSAEEISQGVYKLSPCKAVAVQVQMEMADVEILRQNTSAMLFYVIILTGYDIDGFVEVDSIKSHMDLKDQDMFLFLESLPGFGALKKDHKLSIAATMGSDVFAMFRYMTKNQKAFCPGGYSASQERPSRFGFVRDEGRCLPVEFGNIFENPNGKEIDGQEEMVSLEKYFATMQSFFSGEPVTVYAYDQQNAEYETQANYSAILYNPVPDLKDLFPATFNECGKGKSYKDKTLGGMFPNEDADTFMILTGNLDRACSN